MAGSGRVLTKDLDTRLKVVEDRLGEFAEMLMRLESQARAQLEAEAAADRIAEAQAHQPASNGNGNRGAEFEEKLLRLEAVVARIDDRVEKITNTLVQQAHRFA
jgi:hypothetical protein